jgi:hypothetical protein
MLHNAAVYASTRGSNSHGRQSNSFCKLLPLATCTARLTMHQCMLQLAVATTAPSVAGATPAHGKPCCMHHCRAYGHKAVQQCESNSCCVQLLTLRCVHVRCSEDANAAICSDCCAANDDAFLASGQCGAAHSKCHRTAAGPNAAVHLLLCMRRANFNSLSTRRTQLAL